MAPRDRLYYELAKRVCAEAEVPARQSDELALEYLGDSIRLMCRAAHLRRLGRRDESEEDRLRAEALMEEYRAFNKNHR